MKSFWIILSGLFLALSTLLVWPVSAADNLNVLDGNRQAKTLRAVEVGNILYKVMIPSLEDGTLVDLDDSARIGVVPHEHAGHADLHFHVYDLDASTDYVLVDLSDTTNWPHTAGESIHIDHIDLQVDSDVQSDYLIELHTLRNCGAADCDSMMVWATVGNKTIGASKEIQVPWDLMVPLLSGGPAVFFPTCKKQTTPTGTLQRRLKVIITLTTRPFIPMTVT